MTFSALFGGSPDRDRDTPEAPDARLLQLFSNRLELKKAFSTLKREREELAAALGRAEQDAGGLRRRLEYLEDLLTEPQTAVSAMLFYHLRGLWRRCNKRLSNLAEDLSRSMSSRRQVMAAEQWQDNRRQRLAELERQRTQSEESVDETKNRIASVDTALAAANRFWHVIRRRRLQAEREHLAQTLKAQLIEQGQLIEIERHTRKQKPPAFDELSVEDERTINLHVLALAQYLHAHFSDYGLVEPATLAYHKQVGAIDYGTDDDCRRIMRQSDLAFRSLIATERAPEFRRQIHRQVDLLRAHAVYSSESSKIPEPLPSLDSNGISLRVSEHFSEPAEVLGGDVWTVSSTFLT